MRRWAVVLGVVVIGLLLLGGWAVNWLRLPPRLPAVPESSQLRAMVPDMPDVRYWVGVDLERFVKDVLAAREREGQYLASMGHSGELPPLNVLAVSGGGDNGAFGAGLLCGWSESGNRPAFKAVTGISTGALIAPFAFAGKEYDAVLRNVYTSLGPNDVSRQRNLLAAVIDDALADNRPLWEQISRYVDERLLEAIKKEHEKGRILLIGTTNLDARQPIIWNMGAIAASGAPGALDLMRTILLASAAIPGAFPPSMIKVEVDGTPYEEMHVDGGASAQVFLYPPRLRSMAESMGTTLERLGDVYVIRNSFMHPTYKPVERRMIDIVQPAISSLIYTQGLGDLYRIYATTKRDGLTFKLAYIGDDFNAPKTTEFDTEFMKQLFDYGFRQGKAGYEWKLTPPGYDAAISNIDVPHDAPAP